MLAGLSTLGVQFGYGIETTKGVTPTTIKALNRMNAISGISITPETIDASALADSQTRSVAGRASNGGQWTVTVNFTEETFKEWTDMIAAYKTAIASGLRAWFEVVHPQLTNAFWVVAQPPLDLPLPEFSQNGLMTMEIPLTIEEYKGMAEKVAITGLETAE